MNRAVATLGGLAALVLAIAAFGSAMWATGDGSVLGRVGKAGVLALAGGGIAAACAGLAVALQGIPPRAWVLHSLAVLLAMASYALALGIAETA